MSLQNWRQINSFLTIVVFLLGAYLIILPFWPRIELYINNLLNQSAEYKYHVNFAKDDKASGQNIDNRIPEENTLFIPVIGLDEKIVEGSSLNVINNGGVWRRPNSSTPDVGGNTVLVGHRWIYGGVSTFYNLDKIEVGDRFAVYWQKKEYDYQVYETKVVPASAVEIEAPTSEAIVTLYTCTPIWTAKDRLVVKARLIEI